jgi:hypothetical protein
VSDTAPILRPWPVCRAGRRLPSQFATRQLPARLPPSPTLTYRGLFDHISADGAPVHPVTFPSETLGSDPISARHCTCGALEAFRARA